MLQEFRQQIVISGVGGQGVLFVTRLLAEAAIEKGLPVLTSETHGMAQRGGSVVSYLKVGGFASPLIRPQQANGLLALKSEGIEHYGAYLKPGSWIVVNQAVADKKGPNPKMFPVDADRLALEMDNPRSVNLVVLGHAIARAQTVKAAGGDFFCSLKEIEARLESRLAPNRALLEMSLKALQAGYAYTL